MTRKILCKGCDKVRIRVSKPHSRHYFSKNGKKWKDSNTCNTCWTKELKAIEPELVGPELDQVEFHPSRSCRSCDGQIEKSRYFNCLSCQPFITGDSMDEYNGLISYEVCGFRMSEMPIVYGGGFNSGKS